MLGQVGAGADSTVCSTGAGSCGVLRIFSRLRTSGTGTIPVRGWLYGVLDLWSGAVSSQWL